MPRNILQHVDYKASSACMVCIDIVDSCWLLRYIDLFLSISSTNPSQPPQKKEPHLCEFLQTLPWQQSASWHLWDRPQPSMSCAPSWQDSIGNHTRISEYYGIFQRTWYYDTQNNPTASLHRWWCRYWRHIFQCLSKFENRSGGSNQLPSAALSLGIPTCRDDVPSGCIMDVSLLTSRI